MAHVTERTPFTPTLLLFLIAAFLFALYPQVILGTHSFFDRDFGLFTYPVACYAREQLLHGHLPLWNPLSDCGLPFLAQWNTGVCYPLSIIYVLFPLPWSLNYFCLAHLLLAGLGMYLLARHWTGNSFAATVAGLAYGLNGLSFNCLMWTSNLAALAWVPFVVLYVSRGWTEGGRTLLLGAGAATMQMLAGAPEIALLTWLILASLFLLELFRSHALTLIAPRRFVAIAFLVLALSAMQLLPFFQLLIHSDRTHSDANAAWSLTLSGLGNFFVPLFHCTKTILGSYIQVNQQWTSSYYIGIGILTLALVGIFAVRDPRVCWLAGVLIFSTLLALGNSALLYPVAAHIPLVNAIRYPIKFIVGGIFALPLLAAYAIAAASAWDRRILMKNLSLGGAAVALLTISILVIARFSPAPDEVWTTTLTSGLSRLLLLGLILPALFYASRSFSFSSAFSPSSHPPLPSATEAPRSTLPAARSHALPGFALIALLGLDAITHSPRQNPTVPNSAYAKVERAMAPVPQLGSARAMVSPLAQAVLDRASIPDSLTYYLGNRKALFQNCNLIDKIPKLNGFFSLRVPEYGDIKNILYQPTNYPAGLIDFLGVSQLTSDDNFWTWVRRPSVLPLITGGQQVFFADSHETVTALTKPTFSPRDTVYLPPSAAPFVTATNRTLVDIQKALFSAQGIEARITAATDAVVVISQTSYPAWKAFVNGKPTPLFRANQAFQAVQIPSGSHDLLLVYRDTWFSAGAVITACSLLACVFLWFRLPKAMCHRA